jgi:hypothetical protein
MKPINFNYLKNKKNKLLSFTIYLIITFIVMRELLFSSGMIMYYVNPVIPPFKSQIISRAYTRSYNWNGESLGHPVIYPSEIYFDYILGIFGMLGFDGGILSKLSVFLCILFSGIFMYTFTKELEFNDKSAFISGLYYMISTVMFTKILESHLFYVLGYTLSPLIFLLFIKAIKENKINIKLLILSGIFFALAISQLQFLFMLFPLIAIYTLFVLKQKLIVKLTALFVFCLICLLIHLTWILPLVFTPTVISSLASTLVTFDSFIGTSLSPIDAFRVSGFYFPFFKVSAIKIVPFWNVFSVLFIIIAFIPLLMKPNKNILFFSSTAILLILLICGLKSPFSSFFIWIIKNIVLSGMFREVYHLSFLLVFSYSILLGSAIIAFEKLFVKNVKYYNNVYKHFPFLIYIIIILLYLGPFFTGDFGGNLHSYDFKDYQQLYDDFSLEENDFKVLMMPMGHIVKYDTNWKQWGSDVLQQIFPESVLDPYQNEGTDSQGFVTYIYRKINENGLASSPASVYYLSKDVSSEAKLLGLANVKYIILRKNVISILDNYFDIVKSKLNNSDDFRLVKSYNNESIIVFENKHYIPHIYSSSKMNLFVGDLSMATTNGVFPFITIKNLGKKDIPFTGLYLNREYYMDYVSSFIPEKYITKLTLYAMQTNPYINWAPYHRTWWDDPRFTKSLERDIVVAKKSGANLTLQFNVENTSDYILLIKYSLGALWDYLPDSSFMISLDGEQLKTFNMEDASLGEISWANLTLYNLSKGKHRLTIENIGQNKTCVKGCPVEGETVILKLIAVPYNVFQNSFQKAESYLSRITKDFNIQTIPEYKRLLLDGFKKGSLDYPGEIKIENDIAEFSFQVNKSRNKDSGFGFIRVFDSEDWTNFNKLTFQFYTETSKECDMLIAIYSDRYYKERGDIVRFWLGRFNLMNGWNKISVDLSQVPKDDIDQLYFQVGDSICNQDGKKVTFKFSNFTLINDTSIFFNPIYYDDSLKKISVKKENPTYYKATINTEKPFFLVFSESYDEKWEAFVNEKEKVPDEYHFVANSFANAWFVNKTGNFTITLEYTPQRLWNLGSKISFSIIGILLAFILIPKSKIRRIKEIVIRKRSHSFNCPNPIK